MSWLDVLKTECDRRTINAVAQQLNYSRAAISKVLSGNYPGNTGRIQAAVEHTFHVPTVQCPVLGEIRQAICAEHQSRPFGATSGLRVQLYRTCKNCPYNCHDKERTHAITQ